MTGEDEVQETVADILGKLNDLAKRGFEFFIGGIGVVFLLLGLFVDPTTTVTQIELLLCTSFGFLCSIGSFVVWHKKSALIAKTNFAELEYKKVQVQHNTIRLLQAMDTEKIDSLLEKIT